jgi:hypothetical protein
MQSLKHAPIRRLGIASAAAIAWTALSASAPPVDRDEALRFFEGRTEMVSTVKVLMKKPYSSRTLGKGKILADGSLSLVQHVHDAGQPVEERRWRIQEVDDGRYVGTMSDASGPVTVDEVDGRYRFRFKMKGNLSVEQWLVPERGGDIAQSKVTVKKFGMRVATSEGTIRRF